MNYKEEILLKNYMPDKVTLKNMSNFFYAFSDDTRLKIVILLMMKPFCVGDITNILNINQTTVSHQLKILRGLNIVDCDKQGKNVIYYMKNARIENVFDATVGCF
jgi:ArsR family transcriptional regulator